MFGDNSENNKVAIPLKTYEKLLPWDDALTLMVSAASPEALEEAREEMANSDSDSDSDSEWFQGS